MLEHNRPAMIPFLEKYMDVDLSTENQIQSRLFSNQHLNIKKIWQKLLLTKNNSLKI